MSDVKKENVMSDQNANPMMKGLKNGDEEIT